MNTSNVWHRQNTTTYRKLQHWNDGIAMSLCCSLANCYLPGVCCDATVITQQLVHAGLRCRWNWAQMFPTKSPKHTHWHSLLCTAPVKPSVLHGPHSAAWSDAAAESERTSGQRAAKQMHSYVTGSAAELPSGQGRPAEMKRKRN